MPHFTVACSENILKVVPPAQLIPLVHDAAEATDLFAKGNIKVRLHPYPITHFTVGGSKDDFIHITGDIMGGRTIEQRKHLSREIVLALKPHFPDLAVLSVDIREILPATYSNRSES